MSVFAVEGTEEEAGHKVVLLGNCSVGKTALIRWYTERVFRPTEELSIGSNLHFKEVLYKGRKVKLEIWDTAGQEKYASLGPIHCRNAEAVVICYDVTDNQSFISVDTWHSHPFIPDNVLIVLAGCKSDKVSERVVTEAMGEAKAKSLRPSPLKFFETSVVTQSNVDELFDYIVSHVALRCTKKGNSGDERISLQHPPDAIHSRCDFC